MEELARSGRELYPLIVAPKLDYIFDQIAAGNTEQSVCKTLGISKAAWIATKNRYADLQDLIVRARGSAGELMLNRQFAAACGQTVTTTEEKLTREGDIVTLRKQTFIPQNTNAADLWGRNMLKDYVQAKQDSGATVTVTVQLPAVQAEIDKISAARLALEAELATIDMLPDVTGAYARPGADQAETLPECPESEEPDPFSSNMTA